MGLRPAHRMMPTKSTSPVAVKCFLGIEDVNGLPHGDKGECHAEAACGRAPQGPFKTPISCQEMGASLRICE
ncbi:hypothetical protein HMP0721_0118 [Pseudoramibacter alactolyticus ATCC 23263]|uniref:Uncharacterized protein n=2 Tax=Pseudoramibacter TaxID=113286 RepID=E6MDN6_9FIRM|nr:hypothetical protein HMP0721_0118 [Pseudoramibacter alactolyticus ATCC 23263]